MVINSRLNKSQIGTKGPIPNHEKQPETEGMQKLVHIGTVVLHVMECYMAPDFLFATWLEQ